MTGKIADEALLADLRRIARKLGKQTLTGPEYTENGGQHSTMKFWRRFSSWMKALRAAGLQLTSTQEHTGGISKTELLADIRRVARQLEKASLSRREYSKNDGRYDHSTIREHFGSWPKALRAAGLRPIRFWGISTDALLADLRRVAKRLGKLTIKKDEYDVHGRYCSGTMVCRCGGSWAKALRAAGLKPTPAQEIMRGVSKAAAFADLRRVARKLGKRTLTRGGYTQHGGRYSCTIFKKHFGSWTKALRAVGLKPRKPGRVPETRLLADLRRVARKLGKRTLTKKEYDTNGAQYSHNTLIRRFGSWAAALLRAGLQPTPWQLSISRDSLSSSLRALASIPGLTTEDRVKVAKTVDGVKDLADEVILQLFQRMNLGPMELPSGIPSGVPFWERCIAALQKVQPDPEKLKATGVLERLGRQLHRAVALEVLGREPLSPAEERRVMRELRQRKAA